MAELDKANVVAQLDESIQLIRWVQDNLAEKIVFAVSLVLSTLRHGGKVLLCGNGGSAADAQHIAGEFVGRFARDRRPLPAMALTTDTSVLTAIGNDYGFEQVFARQVEALAAPNDILVAISTSGNSSNIIRAVEAASHAGAKSIGLLGGDGGALRDMVDLALVVPGASAWRSQECHMTIAHLICDLVEQKLLRGED